jgi:pheromone a factor receptor
MIMVFTVYHVIAARINIGIDIAVPATVLCINRRLYLVASPTSVIPSKAEKNRELIIDLVIGVGLPMVVMALCLFF